MKNGLKQLLVIGATGSVGQHVVDVAIEEGFGVRALVRSQEQARGFDAPVEVVVGQLTRRDSLVEAVHGVDSIVFVHGSYGNQETAQAVDYGGVRNVLLALGKKHARIALMTTIGATDRRGAHDWKRRGEWLVRASGLPYTVVRPAWFDCNEPDEHRLLMLQRDKPLTGSPKDGVISRRQLAEVLVRSLRSGAALRKTFELHAVKGSAQDDLEPLFSALDADTEGSLHGAHDVQNMPLEKEPVAVRIDIQQVASR